MWHFDKIILCARIVDWGIICFAADTKAYCVKQHTSSYEHWTWVHKNTISYCKLNHPTLWTKYVSSTVYTSRKAINNVKRTLLFYYSAIVFFFFFFSFVLVWSMKHVNKNCLSIFIPYVFVYLILFYTSVL